MWRRPPALDRGGGPGRNFRRGIDFLENAGDPGHFQTWLARGCRAGVAVCELLAKHGAAPVDAGADSAQFHAKSFCDLVIRKALKITKNDGGPEVRRQFLQARWTSRSRLLCS